jgi:hypothetical protein
VPFGNYIDTEKGVRVMTSSWRRNADEALPARGKIVGGYVNMAFQKSEAELNGFDEALVLTPDGHVNEASAANLFVVRDGVLLTPPVSDDILEGVTRKAILELARDEGIPTETRSIDRSELYVADEMFLCGTGVQISPGRRGRPPPVGSGEVGPVGRLIHDRYFDAVRGTLPQYRHWLRSGHHGSIAIDEPADRVGIRHEHDCHRRRGEVAGHRDAVRQGSKDAKPFDRREPEARSRRDRQPGRDRHLLQPGPPLPGRRR